MDYFIRLNSNRFYTHDYKYARKVAKLWEEVSNIFNNYTLKTYALGFPENIGYKITVDASDIVDFFNKRISKVDINDYYSDPDFYLKISLYTLDGGEMISIGGAQSINIANRFLQDLFISMNLAFPTSLNLWYGEFYEHIDSYDIVAYAPFYSTIPLYNAVKITYQWKYPKIKNISFEKVWSWINKAGIPGVGVAKNVAQKTCFILLNLCSSPEFIIENSLSMSRGFEIILANASQSVSKILNERLELLFGTPSENKKWFNQFYQIRSRVIHGDLPVTRNSREFSFQNEEFLLEFEKPYYQALIMYINLLQKMILTDCNGFKFSQKVKPIINT